MVSSRQINISSFHRDAWVEVDLSAIEANVATIKSWISDSGAGSRADSRADSRKDCRLMAVIKSDAYGHGAVHLSDKLIAAGADWLGVASVDEGCELRSAGIEAPILILSPSPFWAAEMALGTDLDLTVTSLSQVADIEKAVRKASRRMKRKARVHLKVDTGMHRLGVATSDALDLIDYIDKSNDLSLISVFSHLACAADEGPTELQNDRFRAILDQLGKSAGNKSAPFAHLASSEATRAYPWTHHDMVRVGLYLYGLEARKESDELYPALSVRGRINHKSLIPAGEPIGYNWTWTPERESTIASIPIGYADGVDRRLSNRIHGVLHGKRINQVGLISMDQMMFDITDVPEAQEGDLITLVGGDREAGNGATAPSLADWAVMLDTITYELACRLRARLPRIYTRSRKSHSHLLKAGEAESNTPA